MNDRFEYQKVSLIGITKPSPEIFGEDIVSAEDLVAYCARVSNPSNQSNFDTSSKLIKYLIDNQHWSPLEMVAVVMQIDTTRDIARQILRHRSFSFQEFSQRYADPASTLGFVNRETRMQDYKNRQNSTECDIPEINNGWIEMQERVLDSIKEAQKWALDRGIAKEQARAILPEGMTMSRMYMSGNLRSWVHYCQLRMDNGTQAEHRDVANKCWVIICKQFPSISNLVLE